MARRDRYKEFERTMTAAVLADAAFFVLYLIFSGVLWLKVVLAVLTLVVSVGGLVVMYLSQELLKNRSLWMSCGFFAVLVCTVVSLILAFP